MRVLIVASHLRRTDPFGLAFADAGHTVERSVGAPTIDDAAVQSDIVLLDWLVPGASGVDICRQLRLRGSDAYIMLVGDHFDVRDKVAALEAGADDYVAEPLDSREVVARVRALERRSAVIRRAALALGGIQLDERELTAHVGGNRLDLTMREFRLLSYLLRNEGQTVTRADIIGHVWANVGRVASNVVDVYIRRLRTKLGAAGEQVKTIRGVGYRFEAYERAVNS